MSDSPKYDIRATLSCHSRREVLAGAVAWGGLCLAGRQDKPPVLLAVSGKPRERAREYGRACKEPLLKFYAREFGEALPDGSRAREAALRFAADTYKHIGAYSPEVAEELQGLAEGAGIRLEEAVLLNSHEELRYHGLLARIDHCAALAAAPPDTSDGNTYVGQSYEWGWPCRWVHWKRAAGPAVLAYTYPGLLPSVGMNASGLALCATSAGGGAKDLRAGIPYYVLSAQMLYQETLKGAIEEARRARHAGWCTMVLGDGTGRLANVEVAREEVAVETPAGHLARHNYGSRALTRTPEGQEVRHNARTRHLYDLLRKAKGALDRAALQRILEDPVVKGSPIDRMLFNVTRREAFVVGGASRSDSWVSLRVLAE
jgi:isopenicillin-N N-acyltransferase-like protein